MVLKIIVLVALAGLVLWLTIDTTIWAIKKIKAHKKEKSDQQKNNSQKE